MAGLLAVALTAGVLSLVAVAPSATAGPVTFTSPPARSALNNSTSVQPSSSCGYSDPNGPYTFAPGFVGTAEPAMSMSLPAGSQEYFYVGSEDGAAVQTAVSWAPDLNATAAYSRDPSISIGRSSSPSGSFQAGKVREAAIAGLGLSGYSVLTSTWAKRSIVGPGHSGGPETPATGPGLQLQYTLPSSSDVVLVLVGGEGTGLLEQGAPLTALVDDTYSECGADVIASVGIFAAAPGAGRFTTTLTSTTYLTNSGTTLAAVAYVLVPATSTPTGGTVPLSSTTTSTLPTSTTSPVTSRRPKPGAPDFTSIFKPRLIAPSTVKAPSANQAAAFGALNALLATETRLGEELVAMRVSLDRAKAASNANAQGWFLSQTNASADYALAASKLLGRLPVLQATVVKAFATDNMTVTLTAAQFATAKANFVHHLPASFTQMLAVAAAPYKPTTVPEVAALKAAILDTGPIVTALKHTKPKALVLPPALYPSSLTTLEVHVAAALAAYDHLTLQPVSLAGLHEAARPAQTGALLPEDEGPSWDHAGEALHYTETGLEGLGKLGSVFGGEAGTGAAEALEPLGEALGLAFAGCAFAAAGAAFDEGGGGGGGEGGGGSGGGGSSYGDPHEETFSGADYDFQAAGEFTLVKSTTDNLDVQVRQQPYPGSADIAIDTATAMQVGSTVVELAANASGNLQLWVDHKAVPFGSRSFAGGGSLMAQEANWATVSWPDGATASVFSAGTLARERRMPCNTGEALEVTLKVPRSRFGHLTGLLGDPGEPAGQLRGGDGVTYSLDELAEPWESVHDYDVLFDQFGQSWRISQAASLFYYPKGTSTASFTNLTFPSKAVTVSSLAPTSLAAAERDCKAAGVTNSRILADCVYDLGVAGTGDMCLAGAEALVQATNGGPSAKGLPDSSGTLPRTSPTGTATTTTTSRTARTVPPAGATAPVTVGSSTSGAPAVAVDASGNAYVIWQQNTNKLSFCKLAVGATSCNPVTLQGADPSTDEIDGTPSVLLEAGHVYVLDWVDASSADLGGIDEWVSTDGGASFTLVPHAVSFVSYSSQAGPAVELPGGDFGAGYVIPDSNPAFQANSLASPADESESTTSSFARLSPQPASAYTISNLGGVFGSQLTGSPGVLGVFNALQGKGYSPCPSSAGTTGLVYAYAPVSSSTTPAALSGSPGSSSPWHPLAIADCDGGNPTVGGGPSGLGLLETNGTVRPSLVQYRPFSPSSGFGHAVTITTNQQSLDGSLSQDSRGGIYATWFDETTGVQLAYSSDGGTTWSTPKLLFSNSGDPAAISSLVSAVGSSGQGWALYAVGKHEYAQEFSRAEVSSGNS